MSNECKDWLEEQKYVSPCEAIIEDLAYELRCRYNNDFELLKRDTMIALQLLEDEIRLT